jgi:hypothetical protein
MSVAKIQPLRISLPKQIFLKKQIPSNEFPRSSTDDCPLQFLLNPQQRVVAGTTRPSGLACGQFTVNSSYGKEKVTEL